MKPQVSIITPLHNKGAYIAETIESMLAQTMPDWEMIVVENYSTDAGPAIVRDYAAKDVRVRLMEAPPEVRGPGAARNCGLAEATGDWVLFFDADDLLEPTYLSARFETASKDSQVAVVAGPWKIRRGGTNDERKWAYPHGWKPPRGPAPDSIYAFSPWALHAALVRRAILPPAPWLPELDRWPAEDNAFWFRVLLDRSVLWCDDAGAVYRKATLNSRDQAARDSERAWGCLRASLSANREHLRSLGRRPTPAMAATAVRTLENLLHRMEGRENLAKEVREFRARELNDTSWLDPAMLARRVGLKSV